MAKSILQQVIDWGRRKSPWVYHFHAGACQGCSMETRSALTPHYDVERWGIMPQADPRQADILLCTGVPSVHEHAALKQIYAQMPEPKLVIAVGTCACSGGVFQGLYGISGGIDSLIPVDAYLPGCAVQPQDLINTMHKLLQQLEKEQQLQQAYGD